MADKKISQLTAASLPLAGTEVLPIVQSSTTVKVATDDLTVKNVRSNATTGLLQVVGPAASSTRVMTVPNANFTAARTDAAQSFTGDQTLSTGNLIVGTAGKGVDFSANTNAAGMTSELLNDYEEGTWTPTVEGTTSAGTGTYNARNATYTKIGRFVYFQAWINMSAHTGTGDMIITGLPFISQTGGGITYYSSGLLGYGGGLTAPVDSVVTWFIANNSTTIVLNSASTAGSYGTSALALDTSCNFSISGYYVAA